LPSVTQAPVHISPIARDDQNGSHYFGPFVVGANFYAVLGTGNRIRVYKSTDNGVTWNRQDSLNELVCTGSGFGEWDILFDTGTGIITILYISGFTNQLRISTFATSTDTYGAASVDGPGNTNFIRLARFAAGDLLVAFFDTSLPGPSLVIFSGGAWGAVTNFIGNLSLTGLIIGADDIARLIYYNKQAPGLNVFFRTFTHAGVLGGQTAIFSSSYLANSGIDSFAEMPVGRALIWNGNLILPYYGNPTGSGKQAGIYVGTPYTAPIWTFVLADNLVWPGTEFDAYGYCFIDSSNNLILFWCAIDNTVGTSQIYFAINSGTGFAAPVLFYDQVLNPPAGTYSAPVHTLSAFLFSNGNYGAFTAINNTVGGLCEGFYLIGGAAPPPPVPTPPTPTDYWNPGSAETLLCERNYPWIVPPKDAKPMRLANSIPAPAANVVTELWNFQVPDGFWFVFDRLCFQATVAGYVDGSGSLFFILDVNSPVGNPLPVARPIAKFTRQVGELSEPEQVGPVQLYQGDTLRAKVLSVDGTLGVGLPNVIHAIAEGWIFPHSRNI
jgi:hypothetical protein